MGKKPKEKAQERRFAWWQLIVGAVVALLTVLIPLLWNSLKSAPPQFALANPILRPDSVVTIVAQNRAAERKENLNVQFDDLLFRRAGVLISPSYPQCWQFTLQGRGLPDSLLRDGPHWIRAGFAGEALSESLLVYFNTQPPRVNAELRRPEGKSNERILIGSAASELPAPADTLKVEVIFHSESQPIKIPVPVKRVTDQSTGRTYFDFEIPVQGLPKISPHDPSYAAPFFGLRVTDQAGISYYQEESYAQFVAPGNQRFGATGLADIELKRLPMELPLKATGVPDKPGNVKLNIHFSPASQPQRILANGEPAIFLKVTALAQNMRQLEWTNLPERLRLVQAPTVILRDEQQLAVTFDNTYVDQQAPTNHEPSYRVEQTGRDGKMYSSNTVHATKPPEKEAFLSIDNVQKMLKDNNLFDTNLNRSGTGIQHQHQEIERNGVKLMFDGATGLTWQKGGSENQMTIDDALAYIAQLNTTNYGGYNDWRLPFLQEAMSLLEPKTYGQLHLYSIFDRTQRWIWTADKESAGRAWYVDFGNGVCYLSGLGNSGYVRAVRSGQ